MKITKSTHKDNLRYVPIYTSEDIEKNITKNLKLGFNNFKELREALKTIKKYGITDQELKESLKRCKQITESAKKLGKS